MELTKSGRFGSSGYNHTSEGLLLRGEPSHPSGGYPQRPRQSGFLIPNTPDHAEGITRHVLQEAKGVLGLHVEAEMGRRRGGSCHHVGGG
jgi:hypothetical protein